MSNILYYKGFMSSIRFSAEDMLFVGKIEAINDLILFEASTVDQLENEFHLAVDDYLQTCKDLGKAPSKTYSGVFNVRVSQTVHSKLAKIAAKHGVKLNELVKRSLNYLVEHEDEILAK